MQQLAYSSFDWGFYVYVLNPALGDDEIRARVAEIDRLKRDGRISFARSGWLGGCGVLAIVASIIAFLGGVLLLGISVFVVALSLGAWAYAHDSRGINYGDRGDELVADWVKNGDILRESLVDGLNIAPTVSDIDFFRALQLLQRAETGRANIDRAIDLKKLRRLPTGTGLVLGEVAERPAELRQQAVDILDPDGVVSSKLLREEAW